MLEEGFGAFHMAGIMKSLPNLLLRIVDFFLSPRNLASVEARMRARMVVFTFLFWALLDVVMVFFTPLGNWKDSTGIAIAAILNVFCACLIRKSFSPENVQLVASGVFVLFQILGTQYSPVLNPIMVASFINLIYLNCFLIIDLKKRIILLCMVFFANFFVFVALLRRESEGILDVASSDVANGLAFLFASVFAQCVVFSMILKIKAAAQMELDLEVVWQERVKRLEEISSLTRAMRALLVRPVGAFKQDLELLHEGPDGPVIGELQKKLDELVLISKAFSWIYRVHSGEESLSLPSSTFMRHLEVLLSAKAQEEGWALRVERKGQAVEICGPIPAPQQELITALMKACNASIQHSQNENYHRILITRS